ncbi:MAG: OmpH family outer membrane protein [Treponema sp.]|jgi:outer membrane protein|nr:OmpH family outer membrane protein [Treponema sp.]
MKRYLILTLLLGGFLTVLGAQHSITRFAVVDINKVTAAFSDQFASAQSFNEKSAKVQAEIDRRNKELQELNAKLAEAQESGKEDQVKSLETQIKTKTLAVQNYIQTSFADLEKERARLVTNDDFLTRLNSVLKAVGESEGYSMILSKQDGSGILWYSPSVDITNRVIERIRSGNTRR